MYNIWHKCNAIKQYQKNFFSPWFICSLIFFFQGCVFPKVLEIDIYRCEEPCVWWPKKLFWFRQFLHFVFFWRSILFSYYLTKKSSDMEGKGRLTKFEKFFCLQRQITVWNLVEWGFPNLTRSQRSTPRRMSHNLELLTSFEILTLNVQSINQIHAKITFDLLMNLLLKVT